MMEQTILPELRKAVSYVAYRAGNRLLILPGQADIDSCLADLIAHFHITCILPATTDLQTQLRWSAMAAEVLISAEAPQVSGYLGRFGVSGFNDYRFDLVLDLQREPAIASTIAPPGYYRLHNGSQSLTEIVEELPGMIGEFDKPKFFDLHSEKCAHSRREIDGCSECIEACATDAISVAGDTIQINPYLCQGCGDCATVCPAGAINYQYPKRSETLQLIKQSVAQDSSVILIHDGETPAIRADFPVKLLEVEALGSCGIDIWLGALAYGATQVWLLDRDDLTQETRKALTEQIAQAQAILTGLGYPEGLVQLADFDNFVCQSGQVIDRASFVADTDKRTMIRNAVEHLAEQVNARAESCALPMPASFGAIDVSQKECTLCMSCVSVCPEQALLAGSDKPLLKFIEANCVQCGICEQACPEHAISLRPRYLYDSQAVRKPSLLHQEQAFHCVECGTPFATQSMINSILKKLEHHPMFQGDKKRQLMLCEHCKVTAMFGRKA